MENLFRRAKQRKDYLDISEETRKEYLQDYIDETNNNFVDTVIDYIFLVNLPNYIKEKIEEARSPFDLDELEFEIKFDERKIHFPYSSTVFHSMKMYCKKYNYPFDNGIPQGYKMGYNTDCEGLYVDHSLYYELIAEVKSRAKIYDDSEKREGNGKISVEFCTDGNVEYVTIKGSAKDLANIYYSELQAYNYKKGNTEKPIEFDRKELKEKAYSLRIHINSIDNY